MKIQIHPKKFVIELPDNVEAEDFEKEVTRQIQRVALNHDVLDVMVHGYDDVDPDRKFLKWIEKQEEITK
jgi:hypothetical protein